MGTSYIIPVSRGPQVTCVWLLKSMASIADRQLCWFRSRPYLGSHRTDKSLFDASEKFAIERSGWVGVNDEFSDNVGEFVSNDETTSAAESCTVCGDMFDTGCSTNASTMLSTGTKSPRSSILEPCAPTVMLIVYADIQKDLYRSIQGYSTSTSSSNIIKHLPMGQVCA